MVTETKATEKSWEELTPDEKLQKRIDAWLAADGLSFVSVEAEANYKARINRFLDAVTLRKTPDRVPIQPNLGAFLQQYYGYSQKDMLYDADKANDATTKATLEFDVDMQLSAATNQIGRVFDILDYKQYNWPGQRVPDDGEFQFIEDEYLKADEYDAFLQDPSGFWYRQLLPRTVGALEAFKNLSIPTYRNPSVADYGRKDIQEALKKLMAAGDEAVKFNRQLAETTKKLKETGYPTFEGGTSSVPFDFIGDGLRGTVAISVDMFRQPDKLLEALDRCVPLMIERGLASAKMGNAPVVGFAMHKGSDPYMSEKHFQRFYWPQFRKVIEALNNEGLIVRGGCQGFHDKRVETYATLPKGKVYWAMGYGTDFHRAKSVLDGIACITGNVHAALLHHGAMQEVEDYCKDVIAVAGKGGGYIFGTSSIDRNAKPENVRAMVAAAKKYAAY